MIIRNFECPSDMGGAWKKAELRWKPGQILPDHVFSDGLYITVSSTLASLIKGQLELALKILKIFLFVPFKRSTIEKQTRKSKAPWNQLFQLNPFTHLYQWNVHFTIIGRQGRRHFIMVVTILCLFTMSLRCFLPQPQIWPYEIFLSTVTKKGTNIFNGSGNLGKFHCRKRDKSRSKVS